MAKSKHTVASIQRIVSDIQAGDTKNIDFPVIIKAFSGKNVEQVDLGNANDKQLIQELKADIQSCINNIQANPIQSDRVNEVGNKIEQPLIDAINASSNKLMAERPKTKSGKSKSTGYPDILIWDAQNRPTYLEVKTYNSENAETTQRSFYLSPSDEFKVVHDARHLLVAFTIQERKANNYVAACFKLLDLYCLPCDIKFEINSDNKRLYQICQLL